MSMFIVYVIMFLGLPKNTEKHFYHLGYNPCAHVRYITHVRRHAIEATH